MAVISLTVNNRAHQLDLDPETPLLWVLRDHLNLVGTKFGCGGSFCGACTVHLDGVATRSCSTPVGKIARRVTTIEGLIGQRRSPGAARLGGDRRAAVRLLPGGPDHDLRGSSRAQAQSIRRRNYSGDERNICRCGTYVRIKEAVRAAAGKTTSTARGEE